MKRLTCLAMCVLLVGFAASASALPRPDSEDALERQAWQAWEDGEIDELFEICEIAIALDPTAAWPYEAQAESLISHEDFEEAYELLSQGFEAGVESAYMRFYCGSALYCLDRFKEARADLERAIALTDPNDTDSLSRYYHCLSGVLEELELDEASIAAARSAVLKEPDRPELLLNLWIALDGCGQHDEALLFYTQWSESQPEMAGTLDAVRRAEEKYHGGSYEEAVALYGQLAGEEYLPAAVVTHYIQALMRLSRHEDALTELDRGMGDIIPSPLSILLLGDVYFDLGELRAAEAAYKKMYDIYDEEAYQDLNVMPYFMEQAGWRLMELNEYVPPGFEKAFEAPEWAGYTKAADARSALNENFVLMRKDEHNVLCYLRKSKDRGGFVVDWANDKAVHQDGRIPVMTVWWHHDGELEYTYIDDKKPAPGKLDSQTYWFECDEETDEWEFVRVEYNYHRNTEDIYAGFDSLWMVVREDRLVLQLVEYSYDGDFDYVGGYIAEMPYDAEAYALKVFDIARCDADFAFLQQLGESAGEE